MGVIGTVWGAWFAGITLAILDDFTEETAILSVLLASDVGLAISSTLISDIGGMDPLVIAGGSIGGVTLTGLVFLLSSMATDDANTLRKIAIGSSAAGLILGGMATQWLIDIKEANPARPAPGNASSSLGSPIQLLGITPQPHLDESGKMNGMVMNLIFGL